MVDYSFYLNEYRGMVIGPEEWPGLEARAQAQMARWRRNLKLEGSDQDVSMAICALAEALRENDGAGELRSASIGSVSVEYRVRSREKMLLDRVGVFLNVYRGVG